MKLQIQMNSECADPPRSHQLLGWRIGQTMCLGTGHLSQLLDGKRSPTAPVRRRLMAGLSRVLGETVGFDEVFVIAGTGADNVLKPTPSHERQNNTGGRKYE
jgi:hypothetical protein